MSAAEKIEWWGEHPAYLWSLHPGDALWDASGSIEWQGDYPALFWSEHPCDLLWDEGERASLSPANDNGRHLIPLATTLSQQPNGAATHESATFPHARAASGERRALGARARGATRETPRASTRQGEAQPAQARVGFPDITVSSSSSAEQAGGWGLPPLNVEPNTTAGFVIPADLEYPQAELNYATIEAWRYQYNFAGDLIATSDARSCGQNFYYDGAGRILGEDYGPCEPHHAAYSAPTDGRDADNLEVTYYYDDPDTVPTAVKPSGWTGSAPGQSFTVGRAIAVLDRGSASFTTFDGRGRTEKTQTRIAKPVGYHDNGGVEQKDATPDVDVRYAQRVYEKNFDYDAADREISSTTGAAELKNGSTPLVPELLSNDQTSAVTTSYTRRGTVKKAGSSYGSLITSIQRTADNLVTELRYGDAADTRTAYLYDERRRVSSVQTYRGPPASGAWDPLNPNTSTVTEEEPTRQLVLQDEDYIYDVVGNPVEIRDWRDAADWPDGAKPVTKKIEYDDLYRATRIKYEYADGDDTWKSHFQAEVEATATDPRQADPSPHIEFQKRILEQTFQYDWLGNNKKTGDDAAGFYDRSLGTVTENTASGKRYQLKSASIPNGTLGADGQDQSGSLEARYDAAGSMTRMRLIRNGTCLGGVGTDACSQQFIYDWDEVGRLTRARRWDNQVGSLDTIDTFNPATANTPEADLRHTYDASDQRVIKEAVDQLGNESYTLYVFESLELRRTQYDAGFAEDGTSSDYEVSHYTVVPYLLANGVRLARLVYHAQGAVPEEAYDSTGSPGDVSGPGTSNGKLHVFFELGDHLGSTSVVLDKATGELVERSTFQGYGGAESDYRPGRWANFREDYRFTGKEEDVEVGLQYFGKRYLNPLLGRWVSADPLAVHAPGEADWNLYAYVSGAVLKNIDPLGLADGPVSEQAAEPIGTTSDGNTLMSDGSVTIPEVQVHGTVPSGEKNEAGSKGPIPLKSDADYFIAGAFNGTADMVAETIETVGTEGADVRVDEEGEKLVLLTNPDMAEFAEEMRTGNVDTSKGTPEQQELARKGGVIARFFAKLFGIFGIGKTGRVTKPTGGPDLHQHAVAARDKLSAELAKEKHPPATVVGAYSPSSGRVTAGASRGGGLGCAEGVCSEALGHPSDIQFTPAVRPRTGKSVPVCANCESTYGREAFPDPDTEFKTDL